MIQNRFIQALSLTYVNTSDFYRWMIGKVNSEALEEIDVKKQFEVSYKASCATELQTCIDTPFPPLKDMTESPGL